MHVYKIIETEILTLGDRPNLPDAQCCCSCSLDSQRDCALKRGSEDCGVVMAQQRQWGLCYRVTVRAADELAERGSSYAERASNAGASGTDDAHNEPDTRAVYGNRQMRYCNSRNSLWRFPYWYATKETRRKRRCQRVNRSVHSMQVVLLMTVFFFGF